MVAVLDAWTSASGDGRDRRDVFRAGETLQFNCVFVTERDLPSRVRMRFMVESRANAILAIHARNFEVVARPQLILRGEAEVGDAAAHAFSRILVERFDPDAPAEWRGRQTTAQAMANGEFNIIFAPVLYRFQALVQLMDVATGQRFDVSTPTDYTIVS